MNKIFCIITLIIFVFITHNTNSAQSSTPKTITNSQKTTLRIYISSNNQKGFCSATRITESLIITAAHCLYGYDAKTKGQTAQVKTNSKYYDLEIAEKGNFDPNNNKMADWILLQIPQNIQNKLSTSIANFPTHKEMQLTINQSGDFASTNKGMPIWGITYPASLIRTYPRPGSKPNQAFLSKGFLKTEQAYKKSILFTQYHNQVFDEVFQFSPIEFKIDINKAWEELAKEPGDRTFYKLHSKYVKDNNPLLYQSADFANGSSGGGVFIEQTGHLLGIRVMTTTIVNPRHGYNGINYLYRLDKICEQSKTLIKTNKCQKLLH